MHLKTRIRVLLNFILIFGIKSCLSENNASEDVCNCYCDQQVDVVKHFTTQLESLQQLVNRMQAGKSQSLPTNCIEATAGSFTSGIYTIKSQRFGDEPFMIWCDEDTDFGGWIVIQRRVSADVDFYRNWQQYKQGFGKLSGNYWIGLEKLHALTASCEQELYIKMERFDGAKYYAKYDSFVVGSEEEGYVLRTVGGYTGNAVDYLRYHEGSKFTTFDRDNDDYQMGNCAEAFRGAWWYNNCRQSNLNGDYAQKDKFESVTWNGSEEDKSLKFVKMMIRPTGRCMNQLSMKNF